jgi:hypothetical protein
MEAFVIKFLQNANLNFEGIGGEEFVARIVNKAEGVFLWTSLVLKSLQRGVANADGLNELMDRLETLPSGLKELFEEMLKRLGDDQALYRKEAALFFHIKIALDQIPYLRQRNLFTFAVAVDRTLRDKLLVLEATPSSAELKPLLLTVNRKLISRCGGLLETVSDEPEKDINEILSSCKPRFWETLKVVFIHRSAKEFLQDQTNSILKADETTPTERSFWMLQALALQDIYPPATVHKIGENEAFYVLYDGILQLPEEQHAKIFNLAKDIYLRNSWPDIYEAAAYYGFDQCLDALQEEKYDNPGAVRNYLLICIQALRTERSNAMAMRVLELGADPNTVQLRWTDAARGGLLMGCPTPVLGDNLLSALDRDGSLDYEATEMYVSSHIRFGANIESKFLAFENLFGHFAYMKSRLFQTVRPGIIKYGMNESYNVLKEINIAALIRRMCVRHVGNQAEGLAMASRLGLPSTSKVLLYWHGNTAFAVNDEDSGTLGKIVAEHAQISKEQNMEAADEAIKTALDNLQWTLKGKEVHDVHKWLSERGYVVFKEDDDEVKGISDETSFNDMADIYWKLNEKYGVKGKSKGKGKLL